MSDETREITVRPVESEWSVERIVEQTLKIQQCMQAVMKRDEHYGVIPGTGTKPTLLKAGAEKLCLMFRFDPEYEVLSSKESPELFSYTIRCLLWHIPTGVRVASGLGSCNSREEKYQRAAPKKCPKCGKETIFKAKEEHRGWYCWSKKGGCGANFDSDEERAVIDKQESGIKDPSDLSNTILKMACKRALVAAVLNGTAASDCFTQDLEDLTEKAAEYAPPKASADPKAAAPETQPGKEAGKKMSSPTTTGETAAAPADRPPAMATAKPKGSGAADIKHDGQYITEGQLKVLHITRREVGGQYCTDGGKDEDDARSLWRSKVLAVYRDKDGSRIQSSKQLSKTQANHLIDRLAKYAAKTKETLAARDAETNVGDIIPINKPNRAAREPNGMTPATMAITGALKTRDMDASELCSIFGVDDVTEIANDDAEKALALVFAWGTPKYGQLLAEVGGVPQ